MGVRPTAHDPEDGPSCHDKALALLARRPHFRRQLGDKLRRRHFDDDEVEATLDRLEEAGYLDDEEAARGFVRDRGERRGWGSRRVRAELLRRGADPEVVDRVVAELLPEDDTARARVAAERWRRRKGVGREALARHLDRLGYSRRAIVTVLEELPGEEHGPS